MSECDLFIRPHLNKVGPDPQDDVQMIAHHGVAANVDREYRCERFKPFANPNLAVVMIFACDRIDTAKKGPADTPRDTMIHPDLVADNNVTTWAAVRNTDLKDFPAGGGCAMAASRARTVVGLARGERRSDDVCC
jgi:hypothetical protein